MKFLKKLLIFWKLFIVGVIWSYVYLCGTTLLFKSIWGFNYLSRSNWRIISGFWKSGGTIRSGSDYMFIICLILLIPLWLWGWRKLYKANFINLLLIPVNWYQRRSADNYMKSMSRVKLHNIGISIGADIKQDFENKLQKQKTDIENAPKASQNIRSQLKNRLTEQQ